MTIYLVFPIYKAPIRPFEASHHAFLLRYTMVVGVIHSRHAYKIRAHYGRVRPAILLQSGHRLMVAAVAAAATESCL